MQALFQPKHFAELADFLVLAKPRRFPVDGVALARVQPAAACCCLNAAVFKCLRPRSTLGLGALVTLLFVQRIQSSGCRQHMPYMPSQTTYYQRVQPTTSVRTRIHRLSPC
jgi:hypothetical protein